MLRKILPCLAVAAFCVALAASSLLRYRCHFGSANFVYSSEDVRRRLRLLLLLLPPHLRLLLQSVYDSSQQWPLQSTRSGRRLRRRTTRGAAP